MENDFDTDFESTDLDTDFDSTEPTESVQDRQGDATDAIAEMLMSGSTDALDNFESGDGKSFNMGHIRDTDSTRSERPAKYEEPSFAGNQSAPDMQSAQSRAEHFTAQAEATERQWQQLQQMQGDLTPEQFNYQREFLQGQMAANIMQQQAAQIEVMQNQAWLAGEEAKVREKHADVFNDPQKREVYSKKMIDYLGKIGYSAEEMKEIGAREYNAILDMVKLQESHDALKLENAKLKQFYRQRNKQIKQGRRDSAVGARSTSSHEAQQDEVMRILFGK